MPARNRTTQIRLERGTAERLRELAFELGYIQSHGQLAGDGSPARMLEALAKGELQIVKTDAIDSQHDSLPKADGKH